MNADEWEKAQSEISWLTATEGVKNDKQKPLAGTLSDFSQALIEVAKVSTFGAQKYGRRNWLLLAKGRERFTDAMWRHLLQSGYEAIDEESSIDHEIHFVWNALARLELKLRDPEEDE